MTDIWQRQQWAEHLKDEADARLDQQAAAGPDHRPVAGPLPYTAQNLEHAVLAAVLQERDRCARLLEAWVAGERLAKTVPQLGDEQLRAVEQAAAKLAAAMRDG